MSHKSHCLISSKPKPDTGSNVTVSQLLHEQVSSILFSKVMLSQRV